MKKYVGVVGDVVTETVTETLYAWKNDEDVMLYTKTEIPVVGDVCFSSSGDTDVISVVFYNDDGSVNYLLPSGVTSLIYSFARDASSDITTTETTTTDNRKYYLGITGDVTTQVVDVPLYAWKEEGGSSYYYTLSELPSVGDYIYDIDLNPEASIHYVSATFLTADGYSYVCARYSSADTTIEEGQEVDTRNKYQKVTE